MQLQTYMGRAWLQWLEVKSFLLSCGCVFSSKVLVKVLDMIDYCSYTHNLKLLLTVLTVSTPEEGWRAKNKLLVSTLGFSYWNWQYVKINNTLWISFSFIWVNCRLLPWQQTIIKITIFFYFPPICFLFQSKPLWNILKLSSLVKTISDNILI